MGRRFRKQLGALPLPEEGLDGFALLDEDDSGDQVGVGVERELLHSPGCFRLRSLPTADEQ